MIPRADILISQIREESDTVDDNSIKDSVIINYLNDAQRTIQNIIFQSDKLNNTFTTYTRLTAVNDQTEYTLPSNVYVDNSIISVWSLSSDNRPGVRYDKQAFGERANAFGYSIRNNKIILNHSPNDDILVVYNYRLPLMSLRSATISNIVAQTITVTAPISGFDLLSEYYSIVDKYGAQKATDLYLTSYTNPTAVVEGDVTGASTGQYLVSGANSSTHSSLPEECETYLKMFVRRKIDAHINSTKLSNTAVFTSEERADLEDLFVDKHSDIEYPVVVDYDYLDH